MKIKLFKTKAHFKKKDLQFNANFWWELAFYGVFAIALLSCLFGYYLFMRISKEPARPSGEESGKAEKISEDRLEKVLRYFKEREQKSSQIINSPSPVSDLSL